MRISCWVVSCMFVRTWVRYGGANAPQKVHGHTCMTTRLRPLISSRGLIDNANAMVAVPSGAASAPLQLANYCYYPLPIIGGLPVRVAFGQTNGMDSLTCRMTSGKSTGRWEWWSILLPYQLHAGWNFQRQYWQT